MGRNRFSQQEAAEIRDLLQALDQADAEGRRAIRGRLRTDFGFFITDFLEAGRTSFGPEDFDALVSAGDLTIGAELPREPRAPTAMPEPGEGWAEWAEHDPATIRSKYDGGSDFWRAGLDVLRAHAPSRLTYEAIETELSWPRGRWRSVIGGTASHGGGDATRPFHISPPEKSRSGEWEAWMDVGQKEALAGR